MQTLNSKVTDINAFARRAREGSTPSGPSALDECRETASERFTAALEESLRAVAESLLAMAGKTSAMDMYHLHMDARDLAHDHANEIGRAFRTEYLSQFNAACRRERKHEPLAQAGLSLVEPDDLEENLAAQALATAIGNACAEELFALGQRIGLLINDPDMTGGINPLGPETVGNAIIKALNGLDGVSVGIKVRLLAASMLNRRLPERAKAIYQTINTRLVQRGVLPTLRVGLRRAHHDPHASPASGNLEEGHDLFATLSRLVGQGTSRSMPSPGLEPPMWFTPDAASGMSFGTQTSSPGIAGESPLRLLDRLQRGEIGADLGIDPTALAGGRTNVLRGLRQGPLATGMAPLDVMTLDIVALLFDYILDDTRVPDAMKALIGRLQIPVLKLAMRDKGFFAHKSHPARVLLNALADASVGWDESEGHEGGLYRKIADLVQHILDHYKEDAEIFSAALDELHAFLDAEIDQTLRRVDRSAQVVHEFERDEVAHRLAHDEVATRLIGSPLPATMRASLLAWWEPWLASLYMISGNPGQAWTHALANLDDLLWSVTPKLTAEDRRRFLIMLPNLIVRMRADLAAMGRPAADRESFLAALVTCHADAVKGEGHQTDAIDATPTSAGPNADTEEFPASPPTQDFVPIPESTEPLPEKPLLLFAEEADAVPMRAGLAELKRGCWIEYRQEDGSTLRVRLFWISPLKGLYLFSNRVGQQAISITADGLEKKLASGEVTLIDDKPLIERAVDRIVGQYKQAGA